MINYIIIFYVSYFVTFLGYLLAKEEVVIDELKEIQKPIKYIIDTLLLITYSMLLYFLPFSNFVILITISLIILKITSITKDIDFLKQLHNILLFSITFMYTQATESIYLMYITIFPIIILFIENTNQKLHPKMELLKFVLLTIFLILLSVL